MIAVAPMGRVCAALVAIVCLAMVLLLPARARAADELAAIRTAVFDYFEGINTADRARLERAFDPSAALKSVDPSGAIAVEPIADAIARWSRGEAARRRGVILSIDIADGEIARVVFDFDGAYTDFLTLANVGGRWKIIDKVFIRH